MSDLAPVGRALMFVGLVVLVIGAFMTFVGRVPRLPGDILIKRDGTFISIPIGSSIVLSILLTIVLSIILARR